MKKTIPLFGYFLSTMLAAGILFFLAAGLAEPFKELVLLMNDKTTEKTTSEWLVFIILSIIAGTMWTGAWLWFKGSEKRFLEIWFSKNT
ncbi:hypothetical protein [Acidovorax sp. SDU_ACID1]|uniref:hypothetical protein n=1 Tax=Acidovorax sp. SDU_ACID1 TaxID=3136632 RepID=UPI003872D0F1